MKGYYQASPVSMKWLNDLQYYLSTHEADIAYDIEDFGTLRLVWDMFYPEPPKKEGGTEPQKDYMEDMG